MYEAYFNAEKQAAAFTLLKSYDDFAAADPACVQRMLSDVAALAPAQHSGSSSVVTARRGCPRIMGHSATRPG